MDKVDVIFSANLNSIIGPVQTLKRIVSSRSFFLDNGYDLTLFTLDNPNGIQSLSPNQTNSVARRNQSFLVKKMKELARFLAQHSFLYDVLRIKLLLSAPSGLIQQYLSKSREPKVIVFHYIYDCYCYLKQVPEPDAKIVLFVHGDSIRNKMLLEYFPKAKGTRVEEKLDAISDYVIEKVDALVSISKIGAVNFAKEFPQASNKIHTVVNGITDLAEEQKQIVKKKKEVSPSVKYRLISCGTINGRKGQWIVIEALKNLPDEYRNQIQYTIVGDGPQRVTLEEEVRKTGLANVKFVGSVPNGDVYQYLAEANIAILMSSSEGLPLSLIEALRCGLAGISTWVAGIPEVMVDGRNGVLIDRNVEALNNLFMHIADYDWDEMGRKSRKLFEDEYDFERMKIDYLKVIETV